MKLPRPTSEYSLNSFPSAYFLETGQEVRGGGQRLPGIIPQAAQAQPRFRDGWDGFTQYGLNIFSNNDAGNGGAGGLTKSQITQCLHNSSNELSKAIDCGLIEVIKGCHQLANPHITINGKAAKSNMPKKCRENTYAGTSSVHIPCGAC
jgi:hypothetical protein